MKQLTIFRTVVLWLDGSKSIYTMQGVDKKDVETQLLSTLQGMMQEVKGYSFEEIGSGQKQA